MAAESRSERDGRDTVLVQVQSPAPKTGRAPMDGGLGGSNPSSGVIPIGRVGECARRVEGWQSPVYGTRLESERRLKGCPGVQIPLLPPEDRKVCLVL